MADSGTEESSWTFYIQGFMCDEDDQNSSLSSDYETPSLVSDAASSAVKKLTDFDTKLGFPNGIGGNYYNDDHDDNDNNMGRNIISNIMCKQNSLKKQKTKVPVMNYELLDTASSPANSPKISYMNEFMNHKEIKGKEADVFEPKINIFGKGGSLNDHQFEKESSCTDDLKKRNL
ncbi:uncharacterized protein [Henckelia pumila]|uniref:uncharacterized protein n=1 Tax=Henckelia pumila TaxID=405737 RepID=UPI003C6E26B0